MIKAEREEIMDMIKSENLIIEICNSNKYLLKSMLESNYFDLPSIMSFRKKNTLVLNVYKNMFDNIENHVMRQNK